MIEKAKFKKYLAISTAVAVLVFTLGFGKGAQASTKPSNYVVKLANQNREVLNLVANEGSVKPAFAFSSESEFQNIFAFNSDLSLDQIRNILANQALYVEAQSNFSVKDSEVITNDPGFTLDSTRTDKQWGLAKASFPFAWQKNKGSHNVTVAIIDTGVDATHEDLVNQYFVEGYDFLSSTKISPITNTDDNGHGTIVAGIIGAVPNNGLGITGAAWQVSLMPLKALDAGGSGSSLDIAEAIVWAADHHADIINMSVGGLGFAHDTTLANAISYAFEKNVLIVAAAGNDVAVTGGNLDNDPVFPICDDNGENMILGVTATDSNDTKPDFANYGKACVDVSAPGKRILSSINRDPLTRAPIKNAYAFASGTSVAVPYVVAEAVLLKSLNPQATNRQLRDRIISTADNIDTKNINQCANSSCKGLLGAGRINAFRALQDQITPYVQEGDLVQLRSTNEIYFISGAKRHLVVPFVKNQKFPGVNPKPVTNVDLESFPEGNYAEPLDGTLLKSADSPTVYYMQKGLKFPITRQIFDLRGFSFSNVVTLTTGEVNNWLTAGFLAPPEGTIVKSPKNPTQYWVVSGVLHPMNRGFYLSKGLSIFPFVVISDADLKSFSKGDPFIVN